MQILVEPRQELSTWQVLMAILTRAWLKLRYSPPEFAEAIMAVHAMWWGAGLCLPGYAINPERQSLLNGYTEGWFGIWFFLAGGTKFMALAADIWSGKTRWRVLSGLILLGSWAFVTSQFTGPSVDRWLTSGTLNYSGLMLLQGLIFARQVAAARGEVQATDAA